MPLALGLNLVYHLINIIGDSKNLGHRILTLRNYGKINNVCPPLVIGKSATF